MSVDWIGSMSELLLQSSLRVTVVALLIGLMLVATRVRSSAMRHTAWTVVTVGMLLMPALPGVVPAIAVPMPAPAREVFSLVDIPISFAQPHTSPIVTSSAASESPAVQEAAVALQQPARRPPAWLVLLAVVYASVAAFLLGRVAIGWRGATRLVRTATRTSLPAGTPVFESDQIATPVTTGIVRLSIVLPSSWHEWPQATLDAVMAHELAHVRRRDPLVAFVARLNGCVFWFHPIAWWLERQLAAYAEHVCDAAAAHEMGDSRRYAAVLLDMAQAVRRHGGRISWQATGVDGNGLLGQRIDRVLGGEPWSQPSRARTVAVAFSCVAVILAVVACREQLAARPLREDPEVAKRLATEKAGQELSRAASAMTAEQVDQLESSLKSKPDDFDALEKLQVFYGASGQKVFGWNQMVERRRPHILWLIEHHPEHALAVWRISPSADPEGYAAARKAWLNQTARADASVPVLSNAARFFDESDPQVAEELMLRARQLDPDAETLRSGTGVSSPAYWSSRLGFFYGRVMLRPVNPQNGWPMKPLDSDAYALDVSHRLATSEDAVLLAEAGSHLARRSGNDAVRRQLGIRYLHRALQLDPQQNQARVLIFALENSERSQKRGETIRLKQAALVGGEIERKVRSDEKLTAAESEKLRAFEYDAMVSLPEVERLVALAGLVDGSFMWAEHLAYTAKDEAGANASFERSKRAAQGALALAARLPNHPEYGTVIYQANVALGAHALREGDRQTAVRYMLEATKSPGSERLAINQIIGLEGRLVNYLLKAGERESVAEFLEKSARFRISEKERLLRDAAAIRDGRMPMSYQYMVTRAQ